MDTYYDQSLPSGVHSMSQEQDQEMQRDQAAAAQKRPRFEIRQSLLNESPFNPDAQVDSMILSAAASLPFRRTVYPTTSTFTPCFATTLYYLKYMDDLMANTKRWTDNCNGWVPPYSQIYISILLYIQTFRAMRSASLLYPGSKILTLLTHFEHLYPFQIVYVPGPLVQAFKSLTCFWPSATNRFGYVSPSIPARPGWSRERNYRPRDELSSHLPHIYYFASRLRTICSAATRPNVTESSFYRDVDGPNYLANLFSQPCTHANNEQAIVRSPGASFGVTGNLRLWQNAAYSVDYIDAPILLDVNETEVNDDWSSFLGFDENASWFGTINAMMAKYCQFWKGSIPLSECSPNGSFAGSVKCTETGGTLFDTPAWTAQSGSHTSTVHGDENQVGHYSMRSDTNLTFCAETTVEDISEDQLYAASTYNINLVPIGSTPADYMKGRFWDIVPSAYNTSGIQITQSVKSTIARKFHSQTRLYP